MSAARPTYAVITPARDEVEHFRRTAEAIVAQEHRPSAWIIVDDGSVDGTQEIAAEYAARHAWIRLVSLGTRSRRGRGGPIIRAFNTGRAALPGQPDIIVKLDADLHLPPHYFAWVADAFSRDPQAGVVGGVAYVHHDGRWVQDGAINNVNGVAKAYRVACLDAIGGLSESMGWDGIDEYAARARGWHVHVLTELVVLHFRLRGTKQSWMRARWEEGRGCAYMGFLWPWLLLRVVHRMAIERPPILGGLVMLAGFATARLSGAAQVPDRAAREELQREQRLRMRRLLQGAPPRRGEPLPGGGPAFWAGERKQQ